MKALSTFRKHFKGPSYSTVLTVSLLGGYLAYANHRKVTKAAADEDDKRVSQHLLDDIIHSNKIPAGAFSNVAIFSGNANLPLAQEIVQHLGVNLGSIKVGRFNDGEVSIQVLENIRGKDVYIIQPTCPSVNENLMELLLLISTMRRASARKINIVVPYYGYARQDRKTAPRVPISAADTARLIETMGVDRVVAVDLHCGQIQGFFSPNVPVDNLEANIVALSYFTASKGVKLENPIIVSPDAGGVARAKKFQELLKNETEKDVGLAMIIKHREQAGKVASMHLVGNVAGGDVIIVDDMIDTAGTLCEAAKTLKTFGAKRIYAFATHGLFTGNAFDNIRNSVLERIIVTNTIPSRPEEKSIPQIKRLSIAVLLAETIRRLQLKESVSSLFDPKSIKATHPK